MDSAAAPDPNPAPPPVRPALRRSMQLDELFHTRGRVLIGRWSGADLCLPHPTVASHHAMIERTPLGLRVRDLTLTRGITIGRKRYHEPVDITDRQRFGIGPFLFTLEGGVLHFMDNSQGLRLEGRGLEKTIRGAGGKPRKLLDGINLVVEPGEFVSIIGPSGCGKSTLMDALNGRRRATGGSVLANGEDFYADFNHFRQSLGYVPQRDIVHAQLTVQRALYYTARLRLPLDTPRAELQERIDEVVKQMELEPHRSTLIGSLSGGQIKRVSLGAELLAHPSLLYIDEATSGLDAGTEARMMRLFRQLADEGKSVICVTHNLDSIDRCHLILVLAGGRLMYYGPPDLAPAYFGVKRLNEVYDRLAEKTPAQWADEFTASAFYTQHVADRMGVDEPSRVAGAPELGTAARSPVMLESRITPPSEAGAAPPPGSSPPAPSPAFRPHGRVSARIRLARRVVRPIRAGWRQFTVLTARYTELILRDRRSLRLLLMQAPVVAIFLLVGFVHKPYLKRVPVVRDLDPSERHLLSIVHGFNNTVRAGHGVDPASLKSLEKVHFTLAGSGSAKTINAIELAQLLQQIYTSDLDPTESTALKEAQITLDDAGKKTTVSGAELLSVYQQLGKSSLADTLLNGQFPVVPSGQMIEPGYTYILLNIVAITVFWFGCNNAAKEIVKEEAIYGRERAANLRILPYLGSKFLVLSVMSIIQTIMLMGVVYGAMQVLHATLRHDMPPNEYFLGYLPQFGVLALLSITGIAFGLLLSSCVSTPDRANALMPYVLIPQIILGGAIIPISGEPITALATIFSPVCWGFRGIHRGASLLPTYHRMYIPSEYSLRTVCIALTTQMVVMLIATAWFLRKKDVGRT